MDNSLRFPMQDYACVSYITKTKRKQNNNDWSIVTHGIFAAYTTKNPLNNIQNGKLMLQEFQINIFILLK